MLGHHHSHHTQAHFLEHSAGSAISQSHSGPSSGTLCWLCYITVTLGPISGNTLLAVTVTLWPTSWNTLLAVLYHSHTRAHLLEHCWLCLGIITVSHSGPPPGTLCWLCYITVTLGPISWNTLLAVLGHHHSHHTLAHLLEHSAGSATAIISHTQAHLLGHSAGSGIISHTVRVCNEDIVIHVIVYVAISDRASVTDSVCVWQKCLFINPVLHAYIYRWPTTIILYSACYLWPKYIVFLLLWVIERFIY